MSKDSDEIDLLELLAKTILVVRKNALTIFTTFLLGAGIGILYYQISPNVYESQMILQSDILSKSYGERITESLTKLIEEKGTKELSKRLNISQEEATKIAKIKIESAKEEKSQTVKEVEDDHIIVTVEILDNGILPNLQKGMVDYLRNNEFVNIRVNQRRIMYQTMIGKIEKELNSLDTLKIKLYTGHAVYSKSAEMLLIDPTNIHSKIIELNQQLVNFKNSLELVNSIQLVEGFTVFERPVGPRLSYSIAGGVTLGLFFAGFVIAIKGIRSMLRFSEERLGKS